MPASDSFGPDRTDGLSRWKRLHGPGAARRDRPRPGRRLRPDRPGRTRGPRPRRPAALRARSGQRALLGRRRRGGQGPGAEPPSRRAAADGGRFRLEHRQDGLQAVLEIGLVPGRTAELRRLTVTNLGEGTRRLDITSCTAVVLNHPAAHAAHPVFSKLFLQTGWHAAWRALLVQRRPREPGEACPTLVHALLDATEVSFTTSRAGFQGRGRPWHRPAALAAPGPLDGQVGNVLDQVVALRRTLTLAGGASAACTVLFGAAADPDAALALCAGLQDPSAVAAALAAASGLTVTADPPRRPASSPLPTTAGPGAPRRTPPTCASTTASAASAPTAAST